MKKKPQVAEANIRELKSINVPLDIQSPDRLVGYVPTNKSITLTNEIFRALLGDGSDRAFAVSAPYGSGKSSAGLLWCILNESTGKTLSPCVKPLLEACKTKSAEDSPLFRLARRKTKGFALALHGYDKPIVESLHLALQESLKRNQESALLAKVKKLKDNMEGLFQAFELARNEFKKEGCSFLILWDEFGKVLEHAAVNGDSRALLEIQTLAEYSARSGKNNPVVFALLMHQSFGRYANSLPSYVKMEWAKIEGRFKQINYIEDSKEIYELISQVVAGRLGNPNRDRAYFKKLAAESHKLGLFKEFERDALEEVLWSSAPLSPLSLFLLPRISARVAQNERTLFTFLNSAEDAALPAQKSEWVSPAQLFDFFSDLMRMDTSPGGTHRQWVETNVALGKANDEDLEGLLKSLAAVKVGFSQFNVPVNAKLLALGEGNIDGKSQAEISSGLQDLEKKKLVYYKRITDEFSIWQGSDVDIRSAVEEVKARFIEALSLPEFFNKEYAAPFRFPQRYNDEHFIRRYFDGKFIGVKDLQDISGQIGEPEEFSDIKDGRIYYVVTETKDELAKAESLLKTIKHPQVVFAISKELLLLRESMAELKAYHQLLGDPDFCGKDPIVEQELRQLADDAELFLQNKLDKLTAPSEEGPVFWNRGQKEEKIQSSGDLKRYLSVLMEEVFPLTPTINNEMINKSDPSPQIVNARKNIIRGMLDNEGKESLGITGYGPDVAIFRSVFLKTGLYCQNSNGSWSFAEPAQVKEKALREVWKKLWTFWTVPDYSAKDLGKLLLELRKPPYGVREGLHSVLLAASHKASNGAANVFEDGIFLSEFRTETFERMTRNPKAFVIQVPVLEKEYTKYLKDIVTTFSASEKIDGSDLVRAAVKAIVSWMRSLPPVAREEGMVNSQVDQFIRIVKNASDPSQLLRNVFVEESEEKSFASAISYLSQMKASIESVHPDLLSKCLKTIYKVVNVAPTESLLVTLRLWKKTLPGDPLRYLTDPNDTNRMMKGFLTRIENTYQNEDFALRSFAELFAQKSIEHWTANSFAQFEVNLSQTMRRIEVLADSLDIEALSEGSEEISMPWIERRLQAQLGVLKDKLGEEKTRKIIDKVLAKR